MNRRSLGALIALNLVLVIALAMVSLTAQPAAAQFGGGSDYIMISGRVTGRQSQNVVYVVETNSARMIALFFNSANNQLSVIGGRDLGRDSRVTGGGR